jgi:zinc resistance-associated protein
MKKILFILFAIASVAFISSQAMACYWDGYWGGPMGVPMGGFYGNTFAGGAYQGFLDNTAQLRQDLAAKQAEYNVLMAKSNPDPKRAAELSRQITSLHDQLRAQARSYNMPVPRGNYGHGPMRGYGCCW